MTEHEQMQEQIRAGLLEGLIQTVIQVFETMAWSRITYQGEQPRKHFVLASQTCGLIGIRGARDGLVGVALDRHLGLEIVSRITGLPVPNIELEDLADGIAELANMICGGMKAKAGIHGLDLTPPLAVIGQDATVHWKTAHPVRELTFMLDRDIIRVLVSI
ncbi:MAG: chemotaxis protein CheX [Magnetococcales bacterium]|nr:chemotaxis protein CheX [Magnetococcales bacterium]